MKRNNSSGRKNRNAYGLPVGMCIGIAVGTAVGIATHNLGTWIPIGLCLGLALGYNTNDNGNGSDDRQQASRCFSQTE